MQGNDELFLHEQVEGGRRGSGEVDAGASNGGDPMADLPMKSIWELSLSLQVSAKVPLPLGCLPRSTLSVTCPSAQAVP